MENSSQSVPAVFLDRDGVVIEDRNYAYRIEDLHLIHGAVDAMKQILDRGYLLVLVTNQTGIARGFFTIADLEKFHLHLQNKLAASGVELRHIYYCPHFAGGSVERFAIDCECRKPKPGMLLRAASELGIDLKKSFMVGDKESDVQAGQAAGCSSILITKEKSLEHGKFASDLVDAVRRFIVI